METKIGTSMIVNKQEKPGGTKEEFCPTGFTGRMISSLTA